MTATLVDQETLTPPAAHAAVHTRRWAGALPWLVFVAALAVAVSIIDPLPVGVMYDDAMYVVLAKSIAAGHGLRWLNLPGTPPATHFPPGYPAFLALLWKLYPAFPANVLLFKLANALFTAVAAVATFRFVRERWGFGSAGATAFALVALLGIPTLTLSSMVLSEPLFLAMALIALVFAERVAERDRDRRTLLAGLGLWLGAATLVRSHGIALAAALPLVLLLRRRWRDAAWCGIASLAMIVPWQVWVSLHSHVVIPALRGNYESYGGWFVEGLRAGGPGLLVRTVVRNAAALTVPLGALTAPSMPGGVRAAMLVLLGILTVIGIRPLWRRAPVTSVFLVLYAVIVLVWPFAPMRFMWGIWPLVMLGPVLGAREVWSWRPHDVASRAPRAVLLLGALLLAAGYGRYTVRGYRGQWWGSIARTNASALRPMILWARTHTAPNDLLAAEGEGSVYLYADRRAVPLQTFTVAQYFRRRTPDEDAQVMHDILAAYPVRAVVLWSDVTRAAARVLATKRAPELVVRDTFPGGLVLAPVARALP